jgi:hypothetical protein
MVKTKKSTDSNLKCKLAETGSPVLTKDDLETFAMRPVAQRKFNTGIIRFSRLYILNKT